MTSPNLIPTPIVNKNGVHTTVYRAAVGSPAAPAASLPAPIMSGAVTVTATDSAVVMQRLLMVLHNPFVTTPSSISGNRIRRTLEGYPEETQAYISKVISDVDDDDIIDRMLISMLDRRDAPEKIEDTLFVYTELEDMYHELTTERDWNGYEFRPNNESLPLRDHDERTRAQVVALVDATNYFAETGDFRLVEVVEMAKDESGDWMLRISDTALVQLIVDKSEHYVDIIRTIDERSTLDPDLIRSILENDAKPLGDGIL